MKSYLLHSTKELSESLEMLIHFKMLAFKAKDWNSNSKDLSDIDEVLWYTNFQQDVTNSI